MKLPELNADGYLDPGIYLASLEEVLEQFGAGSSARERLGNLLRLILRKLRTESARKYPVLSIAKDQAGLALGKFYIRQTGTGGPGLLNRR